MKKIIIILLLAVAGVAAFQVYAAKPKAKSETVTYDVSMHCKNCENKLTDNLSFIKGVIDCEVSLKDKTVTIVYDPSKVEESKFVEVIEKLGYTAKKRSPAVLSSSRP